MSQIRECSPKAVINQLLDPLRSKYDSGVFKLEKSPLGNLSTNGKPSYTHGMNLDEAKSSLIFPRSDRLQEFKCKERG